MPSPEGRLQQALVSQQHQGHWLSLEKQLKTMCVQHDLAGAELAGERLTGELSTCHTVPVLLLQCMGCSGMAGASCTALRRPTRPPGSNYSPTSAQQKLCRSAKNDSMLRLTMICRRSWGQLPHQQRQQQRQQPGGSTGSLQRGEVLDPFGGDEVPVTLHALTEQEQQLVNVAGTGPAWCQQMAQLFVSW